MRIRNMSRYCPLMFFLFLNISLFSQINTKVLHYQDSGLNKLTGSLDSLKENSGLVKKGLGIQIRGGIKFPESSNYTYETTTGFYGGITFIFPLGKSIDLQPEFNYSNSANQGNNANDRRPGENISTKEIALMLGCKYFLKDFIIKFIPGLGYVTKSGDRFSSDSDRLISITLGLGIYKDISRRLSAGLELRGQWAGALKTGGGGSTFAPFIANLGITYFIPKMNN